MIDKIYLKRYFLLTLLLFFVFLYFPFSCLFKFKVKFYCEILNKMLVQRFKKQEIIDLYLICFEKYKSSLRNSVVS